MYSNIFNIESKNISTHRTIKISNTIKSPDAQFSIIPEDLKKLKKLSKVYFDCLGRPKKFIKKSEKESIKFRRSIFSSLKIKAGEKITTKNIIALRPAIGIDASKYFNILGKTAKFNIPKDSPIFKKHLIN